MRGKVNTREVMYQYLNNISICQISPIFSPPPPLPSKNMFPPLEGAKSISATITSLIGPRLHHHRLQIQTARFQKIWISKIDDQQHLVSMLDLKARDKKMGL